MSETRELCFYFKYLCFLLFFPNAKSAIKTRITGLPVIFTFHFSYKLLRTYLSYHCQLLRYKMKYYGWHSPRNVPRSRWMIVFLPQNSTHSEIPSVTNSLNDPSQCSDPTSLKTVRYTLYKHSLRSVWFPVRHMQWQNTRHWISL